MLDVPQEPLDAEAIASLRPQAQSELVGYGALVVLLVLPFVFALVGMRRARARKLEAASAEGKPAPRAPRVAGAPRASRASRSRKVKKEKPAPSRPRRA